MITKAVAQESTKKIANESNKLNPSALIELFEIDLSEILFERGINPALTTSNAKQDQSSIFRFHNSINLTTSNLTFQGKVYYSLPIEVKGFEFSGSGPLPQPKMRLSASEDSSKALSLLRCQIAKLGDIIGAKMTRRRTFLKYLDEINFLGIEKPVGYEPDSTAEFPRDIYYIDRKVSESKLILEYQLASLLDVEGVKLPRRTIFATKCTFCYRGSGCLYEFDNNKISGKPRKSSLHDGADDGGAKSKYMGRNGFAPPIATINDELFKDIVGVNYIDLTETELQNYDKGEYDPDSTYLQGEYVYISKDGVNYYYVARVSIAAGLGPPNESLWIPDQCSQSIRGCALRFGQSKRLSDGTYQSNVELPFGGFPGTNRLGGRT
jgi:lambda family phage minor tail protein L